MAAPGAVGLGGGVADLGIILAGRTQPAVAAVSAGRRSYGRLGIVDKALARCMSGPGGGNGGQRRTGGGPGPGLAGCGRVAPAGSRRCRDLGACRRRRGTVRQQESAGRGGIVGVDLSFDRRARSRDANPPRPAIDCLGADRRAVHARGGAADVGNGIRRGVGIGDCWIGFVLRRAQDEDIHHRGRRLAPRRGRGGGAGRRCAAPDRVAVGDAASDPVGARSGQSMASVSALGRLGDDGGVRLSGGAADRPQRFSFPRSRAGLGQSVLVGNRRVGPRRLAA